MLTEAPPASAMAEAVPGPGRLRRLDLIGLALFSAAVVWTYISSGATGAAHRTAGAFAAAGAGLVIGRLLGRLGGWVLPAVIAGLAALVWAADPRHILSDAPVAGPFGYVNAKGAFFMIAAGCALAVVAVSGRTVAILAGLAAAIPFMIVPFESQARAPALLIVTVPIFGLLAHTMLGPRRTIALLGLLFAAALITTAALGATHDVATGDRVVDRVVNASITQRRPALWNEAGTMMKEHPLGGVGAGRFGEISATAQADRDARWAHNAYLQQGAEAGVMGLALIVGLFAWAYVRLAAGATDIRPVLAAIVLTAVGIHAALDYIMHFPAIPVLTAALVGSGSVERSAGPTDERRPAF